MGFSAAKTSVATTVIMSGAIPASGSAPTNTLLPPALTQTGGRTQTLNYGTSAGEFDVPCSGQYLLAAGAALELNLYSGGATVSDLTTMFGGAANLRNVKNITVSVVAGGDASGVRVGGASSNPWAGFWSGTFDIFPNGPAASHGSPAGAAVTSTARQLKILNLGAAEVVVEVMVSGTSIAIGQWTGFWGFLTYS